MTVAGVASNSVEAVRQARALRPDVILVDIGLGGESGFDLARLLTQDAQVGDATVLLISARPESDYGELIAASPAADSWSSRSCPRRPSSPSAASEAI